jgi:hypothetical protein
MTEFKTGLIRFTQDEVSSLKDSEFKRYLQYLIDKTKHIKLPEEYNRNCTSEYMNGFKNYLDLCLNRPIDNLTESDVFYIAVVAYRYNYTAPLVCYDQDKVNSLSDTYYWFYLAHTKYFRGVMEVEMYRRRIISKLELVDLSCLNIGYSNEEDKDGIINPGNYSCTEDYRTLSENTVNTNFNMPMETVLHYEPNLIRLINKILKAGGIIAGGFVNNLINPVYKRYFRNNFCRLPFNTNTALAVPEKLSNFILNYDKVDECSTVPKITEDEKLLEHFNVMCKNSTRSVCLAKQNFYKDKFGKLFALDLVRSHDMDIFVTGENHLENVKKIIDAIYFNNGIYISNIHHTESSISFILHDMIKIQIIKRAYKNVEEILGGFDLNPSKAALFLDKEGKWKFVAPQAYIDAAQYGVNVLVPCWQSETFNSRLSKYRKKGYDIYLPGDIIRRFELGERKDLQAKGNLTELVTFIGDPHIWNMRDLSDYDSKSLEYLCKTKGIVTDLVGIEQRVPLILSGNRKPNMNDLFYAYNRTCKAYNHSHYTSFERYELLIKISSLFWRTTNPATQLTGSFNPTKLNYLSGKVKKVTVRVEDEELTTTIEFLYQELVKRSDFFYKEK